MPFYSSIARAFYERPRALLYNNHIVLAQDVEGLGGVGRFKQRCTDRAWWLEACGGNAKSPGRKFE